MVERLGGGLGSLDSEGFQPEEVSSLLIEEAPVLVGGTAGTRVFGFLVKPTNETLATSSCDLVVLNESGEIIARFPSGGESSVAFYSSGILDIEDRSEERDQRISAVLGCIPEKGGWFAKRQNGWAPLDPRRSGEFGFGLRDRADLPQGLEIKALDALKRWK